MRSRTPIASLSVLALLAALWLAAPVPARGGPAVAAAAATRTSPAAAAERTSEVPAPISSSDDVFSDRAIHHYALTLPAARWSRAAARAVHEEWAAAHLRVDGVPFGVVGVRFEGSMGTLGSCFRDGERICPKLPLKIRFDRFVEGRRFFGLERLNFHAMGHDPSLMRERLAYGVFEAAGLPTPRTAWARLSVNGEDQGLFALVEAIDARFTDRHFPRDDGLLYKEAWPLSLDPAYYEERLRTNRGKPHRHLQVTEFARELAAAEGDAERLAVLERWTDVDALMRFMAADRLVGNWDGVTGWFCDQGPCTNHNYYWYAEKHRARLWLLPWDFDDAFRLYDPLFATRDWLLPAAGCDERPLAWGIVPMRHPGCDPLMGALAAAGRQRFRAALAALLDPALDPQRLRARVLAWRALLAPEVASDAQGPSPSDWEAEVEALLDSLPRLRERGAALARGEPVAALGLDLARRNGFEQTRELAVWRSVQARGNPRSRVAASLSLAHALAGRADLRFDFELRDESRDASGAFLQWARLELPFAGGSADLTGTERVELVLRADPPRTLRIEIEGPGYGADDPALRYGWDVEATRTPQRLRLPLRDLALPAWSQAPPAPLAAVLARATALCISPQPRGRLASGLFPPGQSDAGSLEIDDVALVAGSLARP